MRLSVESVLVSVGGARLVSRGARRRYLVYSITKSFIGVIFCRLEAEGALSLEDEIDEELPERPTLRQLLTHTSGLPDYARLPDYAEAVRSRPADPWSDEELLERALADGWEFPPGERFAYSNTGYLLLRRLLERVAGGLGSALQTYVAGPAGLADTAVAEGLYGSYDPRWVGHRSLVSSAEDLRRFWLALLDGRLAAPGVLAGLVDVPVRELGFRRPTYGLGVMADPEAPEGTIVGHGGGGPGYAAASFALRRAGDPVVAVVLSDVEGAPAMEEALRLLRSAAHSPAALRGSAGTSAHRSS